MMAQCWTSAMSLSEVMIALFTYSQLACKGIKDSTIILMSLHLGARAIIFFFYDDIVFGSWL